MYAAIDIGTVTCRLLVADTDGTSMKELYRGYGITNLGEGVDETGMLSLAAIDRVVAKVSEFVEIINSFKTEESSSIAIFAIATSAARDAKNASILTSMLANIGVTLSVVSGAKEAELSFLGVSHDFPNETLLIVDIGGGSTEVILGGSNTGIQCSHSFDIGCRRMTERFLKADPPKSTELEEARAWACAGMLDYFKSMQEKDSSPDRVVAVAGTATSIVSIEKEMEVYDARLVHRSVVDKETLDAIYQSLCGMTLEERQQVVGLDPQRASVMVAGALILEVVMDLSYENAFTVSESDILQGIILDMAAK